jgi:hypothetical protein
MLGVASIGAAKLSLAAGGMSLPSYSDSAKVAYVLQGMIAFWLFGLFRFVVHRSEALDLFHFGIRIATRKW